MQKFDVLKITEVRIPMRIVVEKSFGDNKYN